MRSSSGARRRISRSLDMSSSRKPPRRLPNMLSASAAAATAPPPVPPIPYDSAGYFTKGTYADSPGGTTNALSVADERDNVRHSKTTGLFAQCEMGRVRPPHLERRCAIYEIDDRLSGFHPFHKHQRSVGRLEYRFDRQDSGHHQCDAGSTAEGSTAYFFSAAMDYHNNNEADEWAWRADGEYSFDGDWLKSFRFGVRGTDKRPDDARDQL